MPTAEAMLAAVHAYVDAFERSDPDMAAAIFAADAVIEDPVGSTPHRGADAISAFYVRSMATGARLTLTGPVCIAAAHVAFPFQVRLNLHDRNIAIDVIDTFAFDASGKVSRMHAFFGPSNMTGSPQEE